MNAQLKYQICTINTIRVNLIFPPLEDGVVVEGGDPPAVIEPRADLHVHHLPDVVGVAHSRRVLQRRGGIRILENRIYPVFRAR